ncbi:MAG TPA: copper-binding protein, partial [Burkholderiales bacterium]|nr:copper-binding protein [Burkholderiales bacterium]
AMQFLNPERRNEMKRLIVLAAVLALSIAMIPLSRAQGMGGMDMKGMNMGKDKKSEGKAHKGAGTVKKVDPAGGKVTIAHGPIPTMKWPAMSMTFTVKDKALLGKFSQDKKVEFEFVEQGSNYVITSVK